MLNRGLYAITDSALGDRLLPAVEAALRSGAICVQYRDKSADADKRLTEARALAALCRRYGCPLLINDDVELCFAAGADGVHLGRGDGSLADARRHLGPTAILGATCHASLDFAAEAFLDGADYLAFGAMFPSPTKPGAHPADPAILREARQRFGLPVVAIGGITLDNAPGLIAAGADCLAVISDLFARPDADIEARAAAYRRLFTTEPL